jgi:Flp pilus assembly pilin Flp
MNQKMALKYIKGLGTKINGKFNDINSANGNK